MKRKIKSEPKSSSQHIGYSGKVTITLQKGKTVLSKQVFHNSGSTLLFRFFSYSLAGQYKEAEKYRPSKIKLFSNKSSLAEAKLTPMKDVIELSDFLTDTGAPMITTDNVVNNSSTTFHFIVPNSFIYSLVSQHKINQICLYSADETDRERYLAYFLITDEFNLNWSPIEVANDNINLIIDWEMVTQNGGN